MADGPDLLTAGQAARLLHVVPRVLNGWARRGVVPCVVTAGGERRFRRSDIEGLADDGFAGVREPRRPPPTEGTGGATLPMP